jgi:spore cortex protein
VKRKYVTISATVLMALGLVACGTNNEGASDNGQGNQPLPMGYYSNENHEESGGNADWLNEDNDGPLTEMMDHTIGGESQDREIRGVNNNAAPQGKHGNTLFSRSDKNYHGHLNGNNSEARSSYYTNYDGNLAKKVGKEAATVVNVTDARAVIHDNQVIIGAILEDPQRADETKSSIRDAVKRHVNGKSVTVVTDEGTYNRIRTIDNTLREAGPRDQVNEDIDNMFRSINNEDNS